MPEETEAHTPENLPLSQDGKCRKCDSIAFPLGVDIRTNDKIVHCETGLEYTAENPINVRNHHLFVYIKKIEGQKAL